MSRNRLNPYQGVQMNWDLVKSVQRISLFPLAPSIPTDGLLGWGSFHLIQLPAAEMGFSFGNVLAKRTFLKHEENSAPTPFPSLRKCCWGEKAECLGSQVRVPGGRTLHRTRAPEVCRGFPLEASAGYQWAFACEKTHWDWGKNHDKGLEGAI